MAALTITVHTPVQPPAGAWTAMLKKYAAANKGWVWDADGKRAVRSGGPRAGRMEVWAEQPGNGFPRVTLKATVFPPSTVDLAKFAPKFKASLSEQLDEIVMEAAMMGMDEMLDGLIEGLGEDGFGL